MPQDLISENSELQILRNNFKILQSPGYTRSRTRLNTTPSQAKCFSPPNDFVTIIETYGSTFY
jgi:hypothetical protein